MKRGSLRCLASQKWVGTRWFRSGFEGGRDSHVLPDNANARGHFASSRHDFTCFNFNVLARRVLHMRLARYFDRLQHRVDYLVNLDAFHLEIRPQQHAVLQYRGSQRLYVLGHHEVSLLQSRERPRRRQ